MSSELNVSKSDKLTAEAHQATLIIEQILDELPGATSYNQGGRDFDIATSGVCVDCTNPIASAQLASTALLSRSNLESAPALAVYLKLSSDYYKLQAELATIRAKLHNGQGTEELLNLLEKDVQNLGLIKTHSHNDQDKAT